MILTEIVAHKYEEVRLRKQALPLAELKARVADRPLPIDFVAALCKEGVQLIAEVKRASPSKGALSPDLDPVCLATTYAAHGAAAISVLTDARFFQGTLDDLTHVRSAITNLPILRKDFILDPYQIYESYACGADALLLIVAVLSDRMLAELFALTNDLGMAALVEVHDEEELARALRLRPRVVGINNRNLHDFSVDLATFGRLHPLLPEGVVAVSESGVRTVADLRSLAGMGADAVLVGEALITAADAGVKVHEFVTGGHL